MIPSFSRKGCPYDNACVESFHASLKKKKKYIKRNMATLRLRELAYLSTLGWYNRKQIHGILVI